MLGRQRKEADATAKFMSGIRANIVLMFTPAQREKLRLLLGDRDELITLLARSDPAAADRLFAIYSTYKKLTSNRS